MPERRQIISMDPDMYMKRMLHYKEKHSGWIIFRSIYWSIFLIVVGILLIDMQALGFTLNSFLGLVLFILAIMWIVYGFVISLHLKLMKKYG